MNRHFSDAELAAFLDGTLDDGRAEQLALALETDEALAERLEQMDPLRADIRDAFDPVLAMPVPERLDQAARAQQGADDTDNIVSFAAAKAKRESTRFRWTQYAAMAASLAIGVVIGGQSGLITSGADADAIIVASQGGPQVAPPLAKFLAGTASGGTEQIDGLGLARASISFRDTDQRLCRQFSIERSATATDGVACLSEGAWAVAAVGTRAIEGGEIRPASGDAAPAVIAAVDAMIEGDPLDAAAESAALKDLAR